MFPTDSEKIKQIMYSQYPFASLFPGTEESEILKAKKNPEKWVIVFIKCILVTEITSR